MNHKFLFLRILPQIVGLLALVLLSSITAFSQTGRQITGKVTNEKDEGLSGATVTLIGSTRGVITDEHGSYSINDIKRNDKLLFSYLGMKSDTILVEMKNVINVVLAPKGDALQGVTVVAFGEQKKESVVGSITTIRPGELRTPSSNLTTALAGRLAGVIAYQRSGEPGADNADFFIRGVTSFGYSNRPLILIDGVETTTENLARMSVDDISSFSIMKDATATALYGARGANGVILIKTKEGEEGKAQVSLRYETSISAPTQMIKLADPITYMKLANEAVATRDPLGFKPYSQEKVAQTAAGRNPLLYPATDWYSKLFKNNTINHRAHVNVRGGGKVAQYYVAATYSRDNGVLKVDKLNNFNNNIQLNTYDLRSNVNIKLTKSTEIVVRLNAVWSDYTGPIGSGTALYNEVMHTNPVLFPAYYPPDSNNIYTHHVLFGNYDLGQYKNPYADMVKGYQNYTHSTILSQFEVNQDLGFLIKGLKLSGMFNSTRYSEYSVQRSYNPFYYSMGLYNEKTGNYTLNSLNPTTGTEYLGYSENGKRISVANYLQTVLTYSHDFPSKQSIGGSLIYTMRNALSSNAGTLQKSLPHRNVGLAGRLTYSYKSRYFLETNFGYNGSERFAESHRYGFFPSAGLAWYISHETFWQGTIKKIIPKLKLKATYGLVGNDQIGSDDDRFFYLSEVKLNDGSRGHTFGTDFGYTINGVVVSRYADPNITWEKAKKTNLGIEMNLFNMFDINADIYQEQRTNILLARSYIPTTLGLGNVIPKASVGAASSKGIDLSLDFNKSYQRGWWVSGRANFTYAVGKYTVYSEPDYSATPWKSRIGQPIGQTFGYVADRLFVDDKEVENSPYQGGEVMGGDIKYKDINGDGQINELDEVPIGFPTTPEIVYGFGISGGHKSIDISFFFQGLGRESFWIDPSATAPFVNNNALLKVYADSHWSEDDRNLKALWPRLSNTVNANNSQTSTWFMRNGSFLRLKQVEVGYSLPENFLKKINVRKVRIYINGTNLFTFSYFKLWDPEMGGNGLGYPVQRVINFGILCSF